MGTVTQFERQFVKINVAQEIINGLGTHFGNELCRVRILKLCILHWQFVQKLQIFIFREEVKFAKNTIINPTSVFLVFRGKHTGIYNDIALIVYNRLKLLGRNTKKIAHLAWECTEVPDVSNRHLKLNVTTAFTAHFLLGNFNTATVADRTFITYAFIFTAITLIVLDRTKNLSQNKPSRSGLYVR